MVAQLNCTVTQVQSKRINLLSSTVSGQFRCARYKCGISACKQSNLCGCDGFCTNLCCANDIVILTGPREQNGHLGGLKAESDKLRKIHENQENDSGIPWRMKNELN